MRRIAVVRAGLLSQRLLPGQHGGCALFHLRVGSKVALVLVLILVEVLELCKQHGCAWEGRPWM